jgi:L-lysine 2,3-aminomutase
LGGIVLLNQAVLLKNINDSVDALVNLSEKLFAIGVMPYYLHLLDKVAGSAHFYVEEEKARELVRQVTQRISGYLVPKLVFEQSGALSKINLF